MHNKLKKRYIRLLTGLVIISALFVLSYLVGWHQPEPVIEPEKEPANFIVEEQTKPDSQILALNSKPEDILADSQVAKALELATPAPAPPVPKKTKSTLTARPVKALQATKPKKVKPKEPQEPQKEPTSKVPGPPKRLHVTGQAIFTKGFPQGFRQQVKSPEGFKIDEELHYKGEALARFEITAADNKKGIIRSEILYGKHKEKEQRVGLVMYFPAEDWTVKENVADIITQWHGYEDKHLGEKSLVPPIALYVKNGNLGLMINWDDEEVTTNDSIDGKKTFSLGPLPKDQFVEMIWHHRFSYKDDGFTRLTINGKRVVDYKGPNMYNDKRPIPYFKVGIYKRKHPKARKRSLLVGNIRIAGANSINADVQP